MKKAFCLFICATMFMAVRANDTSRQDENLVGGKNPVEEKSVLFDVKLTENKTYKVGERVEFVVDGKPASIDFFSGQTGHKYEHRNGKVNPAAMSLDFRLHKDREESSPTFFLLVSTDFDGDFSSFESVTEQNWIDVTDRVTFPEAGKYAAVTIDFSDLTIVGKPFYFAIKYKNILNNDGQRVGWTVRGPKWHSVTSSGKKLIGHITSDENTMGFKLVSERPDLPIDVGVQQNFPDRFNLRGHRHDTKEAESWIVSKAFTGVKGVAGDPDVAMTIEGTDLPKYSHVYTAPGTYTAHFVASVKDENGVSREEIKEVEFVVEL